MTTRKAVRSLAVLASGASVALLGLVATPGLAGAATPAPQGSTPPKISVVAGDQQLTVTWSIRAGDASQQLTARATGDTTKSCTTTIGIGSCTITGLTNGTRYDVTVSDGGQGTIEEGSAAPTASSSIPIEPITSPAFPVDPLPIDPSPNLPASLGVIVGDQQLTITWDAKGSGPSTSIAATATGDVTESCTASASDGSCTITGLTDGAAYGVSVTITNDSTTTIDEGSWTPAAPVTDPGSSQPATFDSVSVVPGDQQLVVAWDPTTGDSNETITVTATGDVTQSCTAPLSAGTCTISELTDAISYDVVVSIDAADGTTSSSIDEGSWTPQSSVAAPAITNGSAIAGDGSVTVNFESAVGPSSWLTATAININNPSDASAIEVSNGSGPSGCTVGSDTAGCVIGGLTDGQTYDVTVQAPEIGYYLTDLGNVTPSAPAGATAPDAPTGVTVKAWVSNWASTPNVFVAWSPAANDGGSVVHRYDVTINSADGSTQASCSTTSVDESACFMGGGLQYGTAYAVSVTETNGVGTSAPATTTFTTPEAPSYDTTVTADPSGAGFLVSFTEPSANWDFTPGAFTVSDASGDICVAVANGAGTVDSCVLATSDGRAPTGITIEPADGCRYPTPIPIDTPPVIIDWGVNAGSDPLTLDKTGHGGPAHFSGPQTPVGRPGAPAPATTSAAATDVAPASATHVDTSLIATPPVPTTLVSPKPSTAPSTILLADHPVGAPGATDMWWLTMVVLGGVTLALSGAVALRRRT